MRLPVLRRKRLAATERYPSPAPARALHRRMDQPPAAIDIAAFDQVEVRVGTIIDAQAFAEARKPSIKLWIDFGGALGVRQSSAQITAHYVPDRLIGRQVVAVVNLAPRCVAGFESQVLVLGLPDENNEVVLLRPDIKVPDGGRMY